ncbi:MAG TPA: type II toxin-antitoxin system RelE/ParE family toxin [Mariniphaga anaerophila]|uniref:Toxin n=1 Tax=Mariniphaga anaerophila TaxID=1484053 RepID=A0A831LSQ0_9BACT|nr:type II toxin-antitoxin system RelE/ParE family toxin [Mariniphaga anaerophila]
MANFYFTNKAINDLTQIWEFTFEKWSEKQADRYYNDILNACKRIATNSDISRKYFKVVPDLLGLQINRHIIFFRRIDSDFVEITRILHEKMDLKNRILE